LGAKERNRKNISISELGVESCVIDKFKTKLSTYKADQLSHAARLELIKSVFSSILVYYMSNILFSKFFIAKLTAIIRNFWWTGIRKDSNSRSLCLRAWKDICIPKKEGGLGIRNLQTRRRRAELDPSS
jgi:hypothetical protein